MFLQFQDNLAQEISDSQDLLESHIAALEKQFDGKSKCFETCYKSPWWCNDTSSELEKLSDKLEPSVQLGHVLYDLEQLKILTQTV